MRAVENDNSFALRYPIGCSPADYKVAKEIEARSLWKKIVDSATKTAEPGILMWDSIIKHLPA